MENLNATNGNLNTINKANMGLEQLLGGMILTFLSVVSFCGNSLVVSSVCAVDKIRRTVFMKTKLSLAISTIGFTSVLVMYIFDFFLFYPGKKQLWQFLWQKVEFTAAGYFICTSVYTLAVMALLRFHAIKNPLKYMRFSANKQILLIVGAWIPGFILIILLLFYDQKSSTDRGSFGIVLICFHFFVPSAMLFICTVAMLVAFLWNEHKSDVRDIGVTSSQRDHKKMVQMTCLMVCGYGITSGCFAAVFGPHFAMGEDITASVVEVSTIQSTAQILVNFTCVVDVLIYSIFDEHFRHHVKRVYSRALKQCQRM